jgi:hypothetical protein
VTDVVSVNSNASLSQPSRTLGASGRRTDPTRAISLHPVIAADLDATPLSTYDGVYANQASAEVSAATPLRDATAGLASREGA